MSIREEELQGQDMRIHTSNFLLLFGPTFTLRKDAKKFQINIRERKDAKESCRFVL